MFWVTMLMLKRIRCVWIGFSCCVCFQTSLIHSVEFELNFESESESEVTYGQVWWPILGICALRFNPSKVHTHSSEHTHCEHTPGAVGSHLCYGARGAVGGSVPCSRAPSVVVLRVERALVIHSPTYNSCRPETRTRNFWITSPTL